MKDFIRSLFTLPAIVAFVLGVFLSGWVMSFVGKARGATTSRTGG
jgi:hypothetical protein